MHVLVAIIVLFVLGGAGCVGGLWGLSGVLARRADRVGVGSLRAGLIVDRFRIPMFLWAVGLGLVGVVLGVVWIRHIDVAIALVLGLAFAGVAVTAIPKFAPAWGVKLAKGVGRTVSAQAKRRWRQRS